MTTQNYGSLDLFNIISQEIREQMQYALSPLNAFTFDCGVNAQQFSEAGSTVTVHLYLNATAPAVQVISGGASINYALSSTQSAVNLTPVPVALQFYQSDGFTVPEIVQANSPAKDLVKKLGGKKIWQMAVAIITQINTAISTSVYTNTVSVSGSGGSASTGYTWAIHQKVIAQARLAGFAPAETSVTLTSVQYANLVASLPVLPGIQVNDVLTSGMIDNLGGARIYRSDSLPAGFVGYVSTPNALAIAFRALPAPQDSYGTIRNVTAADDEYGIALRVRYWTDPAAPNPNVAFDCVYGFNVFDPAALIPILN